MPKLQIHSLANLLPRMTDAEFGALKSDIELTRAVREPAVLLDGKILDGRHRAQACDDLGIELPTIDFDPAWGSPTRYVYSKAVHRNLNDSQKACAAVLIADEIGKEATERSAANLLQNSTKNQNLSTKGTKGAKEESGGNFATSEASALRVKGMTRKQAEIWLATKSRGWLEKHMTAKGLGKLSVAKNFHVSEMREMIVEKMVADAAAASPPAPSVKTRDIAGTFFGVCGRYVQDAKLVRSQQPKLFADVMAGALTLSRAKAEVRRQVKRAVYDKHLATEEQFTDAKWEIIKGDCLEKMESLPRRSFNLIFADPPYNLGIDYGDGEKADRLPDEDYLAWCRKWIGQCAELLSPVGTMCVLINDEWADYFGIMLREAGLARRSWIKWFESFGVNCNDNFNRCSRHLFYCVKTTTGFTFNAAAFNRKSDRQVKYADARANPRGKIWDNVWGINPPIPRLVDNARERLPDFKTQLPLALLTPIVAGFSNPGDSVLDPFSGSGTTVAAAHRLGRKGTGIEKNAARAKQSRVRIQGGF